MQIWQEAVKKSPQLAAGLEQELEPVESLTNMARCTGPLKANRGQARPLQCKQTVFG